MMHEQIIMYKISVKALHKRPVVAVFQPYSVIQSCIIDNTIYPAKPVPDIFYRLTTLVRVGKFCYFMMSNEITSAQVLQSHFVICCIPSDNYRQGPFHSELSRYSKADSLRASANYNNFIRKLEIH